MGANYSKMGNETEVVLVPRKPTKEMLKAAWADALGEDAFGMWNSMLEAWLNGQQRKIG